ncbi:hypothetical protein vseg_013186 [Gypsophila vaccaria]
MTPSEEKLILELHSQWGNRWSRIARRLPGRTDNEIKNYWRTHMRKQAQQKKRELSPSSSSLVNSSFSSDSAAENSVTITESSSMFRSTEAPERSALRDKKHQKDESKKEDEFYSMDDIWKDITSEEEQIKPVYDGYSEDSFLSCPPMVSPLWEYCPDTFWRLEEDGSKILFSTNDAFVSSYQNENASNL